MRKGKNRVGQSAGGPLENQASATQSAQAIAKRYCGSSDGLSPNRSPSDFREINYKMRTAK